MHIEYRAPTAEEYTGLRSLVGWWDTDRDATATALKHSLFSVVAVEKGAVVGCARVIGDRGLYFYLQDLIVHPDFQSRGLGKSLMTELMKYVTANAQSGEHGYY